MASRNLGGSQGLGRQSIMTSGSAMKSRQLTHLHSQLAQLSANLADTENLLRMTSVQAEAMRGLGSWHGGLFMAASKVLGEESVKEAGKS
ncbi:DASH complex subunit Hsk3 like domain-containing protein [Trichoderma novae-zelandiae]